MSNTRRRIVIVGAGPIGLTLSLLLANRGLETTVLESGPDSIRAEWRGSTLHPPTLKLLDELGLATTAIAEGVKVDAIQYRDLEFDSSNIAEFTYNCLGGRHHYPFRIQYEQYKLLRLLRQTAMQHDKVELLFEHELVGIDSDEDAVTLTVGKDDGITRIEADWLFGADGAHSAVRKHLETPFPGSTYPTLTLVVAAALPFHEYVAELSEASYWSGPLGRTSLIHTPDIWRVALGTSDPVGSVDIHAEKEIPPFEALHPSYRYAMEKIFGSSKPWQGIRIEQYQYFRSHQRVAATFAADRIALVGDAAHLNATTGGMGLNSGMHDAWELAKQFAPNIDDPHACGRSLSAYGAARRNAAVNSVQPTTTSNRAVVDQVESQTRHHNLTRLIQISQDPDEHLRHVMKISMFDSAPDDLSYPRLRKA